MKTRPLYFEIFCIALAAMLLEIAYTRVFSFKLYYYFTYLIIGVGLLGLGAGGVAVAVSKRLREADPARLVPILSLAAGSLVLVGYLVIATAPINASELTLDLWEPLKLAGACLCLAAPFIAVGIAIATILGDRPSDASRLYGADLLGAGLGCVMSIPLIGWLDPPRCVMLAGLLMLAAGARLAVPRGQRREDDADELRHEAQAAEHVGVALLNHLRPNGVVAVVDRGVRLDERVARRRASDACDPGAVAAAPRAR